LPESPGGLAVHSVTVISWFPESHEGLPFSGVTQRSPISRSHTEDSGFPESPGTQDSRSHPEDSGLPKSHGGLSFHGVTRKTPGFRSHPEDPVFPESPGTPGSRTHPEHSVFPESPWVIRSYGRPRVPGVTHRSPLSRSHPEESGFSESRGVPPFPKSLGTPCSRSHSNLRVLGVSLNFVLPVAHEEIRVSGVTRRTPGIRSHSELREWDPLLYSAVFLQPDWSNTLVSYSENFAI